jgi:hypothetical protein
LIQGWSASKYFFETFPDPYLGGSGPFAVTMAAEMFAKEI